MCQGTQPQKSESEIKDGREYMDPGREREQAVQKPRGYRE